MFDLNKHPQLKQYLDESQRLIREGNAEQSANVLRKSFEIVMHLLALTHIQIYKGKHYNQVNYRETKLCYKTLYANGIISRDDCELLDAIVTVTNSGSHAKGTGKTIDFNSRREVEKYKTDVNYYISFVKRELDNVPDYLIAESCGTSTSRKNVKSRKQDKYQEHESSPVKTHETQSVFHENVRRNLEQLRRAGLLPKEYEDKCVDGQEYNITQARQESLQEKYEQAYQSYEQSEKATRAKQLLNERKQKQRLMCKYAEEWFDMNPQKQHKTVSGDNGFLSDDYMISMIIASRAKSTKINEDILDYVTCSGTLYTMYPVEFIKLNSFNDNFIIYKGNKIITSFIKIEKTYDSCEYNVKVVLYVESHVGLHSLTPALTYNDNCEKDELDVYYGDYSTDYPIASLRLSKII